MDVHTDFKPEPAPKRASKGLRRTAGFRRNPTLAAQFRFAVLHEFGGRCILAESPSGAGLPGEPDVPWSEWRFGPCEGELDPAHILPKQTLRKLGFSEQVAFDPRNGMALCRRHHERNDRGTERVPRELLPPSVEEFAKAHGLTYLLDKLYERSTG